MFAGALRLLMAPLRTVLGGRSSNLQDVGPDVAMLVPMAKQQRDNEEGVEGTMPHRAVQLSPEAAKGTLRLGFQWRGHAEMDLICLAMQADGKLSSHVWEGNRGCLQSMGIHFQPCNPASPDADDEDDDENDRAEVGPTMALQLQNVPDSTFACVFALVARGETGSWTSLAAFLKVQEATMTLAQHGKDQPFWRYNQTSAKEVANVWVSSCLYRGPHGSWRLEPLNMKLMMMEIDDPAVAYDDAAAEAARATAWQLRWLMKDRCWNSASEERRLRNPGHRGA
ncbi:unnamed protein product [Polarella glacialis]|uniref:Uncharacterized protein n=1 Tax=Polarella glacialis TaxID=89957 RepID=A0A813LFF3_POLGL|nr:unnamed protein product [Polarella glacialis]